MTNNFTPAKAGQQSKRLSKEEYAEKMKAEKEAVYQMADDTAKAIVSDPETVSYTHLTLPTILLV